jgi:hypothetical protein
MRLLAVVLVVAGLFLASGTSSAEAVPSVSFKCTPAPQDCSGWYRSDVSIAWTVLPSGSVVAGCENKMFTTDTAGTDEFCSADDGTARVTVQLKIRVDKTPPMVTRGEPSRAADVNGWYNHPVGITFTGSDRTSGIDACTDTTYGGPDSAAASVSGTCTDKAGNPSAPLGYGLKYDATGPFEIAARPERPPDHAGWYTSPVRFDFSALDATSGVANCQPVTFSGPDMADAAITGQCSDHAGNTSSRAFALKYDATAPPLTDLTATAGDRSVALSWRTTADAESAEISRNPGLGSEPATVVFRGPGTSFVDARVENGVRYVYEVRARDAAGNTSMATTVAVPTAPRDQRTGTDSPGGASNDPAPPEQTARHRRRLIAPPRGAVVKLGDPPLLRWTPIRGARYYNVQLFRKGRKILSVWPSRPRYQLKQHWTYRGQRRRLGVARYRWVVWPGFGKRSKADYGRRIGPGRFVVRRRTPAAAGGGLSTRGNPAVRVGMTGRGRAASKRILEVL